MRSDNRVLARGIVLLVLTAFVAGCETTTSSDTTIAALDVVVEPETVTAVPSMSAEFQWMASFAATFTETAGTGATIESVRATVTETSGGIAIVSDEDEVFQLDVDTSANRIEASTSQSLSFDVFYTLPGGGTESTIAVTVSVIDDNGVEVGGTLEVTVL